MTTSRGTSYRILVVDDEPVVCDSIRLLLTFDGHQVSTAQSGEEAAALFDPNTTEVLITDYAMKGMSGAQLAIQLRKRAPSLAVILVTAYAEMLESWEADLSAVDRVVSKPFRMEDLRSALAEVCSRSPVA
jgi:CheY-like chemotaxis protein